MKAKIVEVESHKLDPNATYLMVFDVRNIKMEDVHDFSNYLNEKGIEGILVGVAGNPGESVKIIEQTPEANNE